MVTYYKIGKTTPVNYLGIKSNVSAFLNGSTAATSIIAIDDFPGAVDYAKPFEETKDSHSQGAIVYQSYSTKVNPGKLLIPSHPMKSGKWWQYVLGKLSNTSSYKHTITELNTFPYFVIHGEMEHATTANSVYIDMLGPVVEKAAMIWGDEEVATQSFDLMISNHVTGSDLVRPTGLDTKGNYMAGAHTTVLEYNGTSTNCTIIHGEVHVAKTIKLIRSGSLTPTDALVTKIKYDIYLDAYLTNRTLIDVPFKPESLSSAKINLAAKIWRSATDDYCNWSFTNLKFGTPIYAQKIDHGEYYFKARIHLQPTGKRTGVSENKTTLVFVDDISGGKY